MKLLAAVSVLLPLVLYGCNSENDLIGIWKATSGDMSFAKGRIPPEKIEEAMQMMLKESAPAFDLNSDGTARVFGGGKKCRGSWSVDKNIVNVSCPNSFIKLERNGDRLTSLPGRTNTFERQ